MTPWFRTSRTYVLAAALCLGGWLLFAGPAPVYAAETDGTDNDTCTSCHEEESDAWLNSPHVSAVPDALSGGAGASCVDCHGPYVKGHPDEGTIKLSVDSSQCQSCHTDTYDQWQHTQHAGEGVQCISCHSPHSQQLRLTDEKLCQSCHREAVSDSLHVAHWDNDVTCTNCHMNGATLPSALASADPNLAVAVPNHDFTAISTVSCLECHRADVEAKTVSTHAAPAPAAQPVKVEPVAEPKPLVLASISIANLGLGVGFGGVLGILFMLVAARITLRRDS